ncbi:tRNA (N6-threonylcarbamoyladenosine(37)-N6)-methyltransferase TrmO [Psychrobacter sp. 28M-43]|uniref:tRNA (N6-threonylcarbamoyladenosine(37)-N6)-methyltransferase TrmO n=1 Tax=Psychrobacter sp. 28M-43 TaxID=2772254 RepID=UPI00168CF5B3|nr:tRNA (N6-threonylcarbamoyladenosine(37)-N6)-methyltransferase TrmO [Psychrobacter sp. 28M-43]QOD13596.1 tRNA (N6-threonylcarbamoyladenosine(37)-N6)-methyltransferase TrmO [Psychrobacter sp. 28M-43]
MLDENPLLDNYYQAPIIGYHRAPLSQKFGAPRQPNLVALTSVIEMLALYDTPAAFDGLDKFSHIWVSWQFHHNYRYKNNNETSTSFRAQVRPPRLGGNQKIGVFASRSMYRPSGLGLSVVKLEQVKIIQGRVLLIIKGADMIDGTPIIDIKPYVAYSDALIQAQSGFAPTAPELLNVTVTDAANEQFMMLVSAGESSNANNDKSIKDANTGLNSATVASTVHRIQNQVVASDMSIIKELIAQDPRPAYRRTEIATPFVMRYKSVDVSFQLMKSGQLQIIAVVAI